MTPHRQHHSCLSPAFTLIELLITVTIIVVLAALSLTALSKMRASVDRVVTMRNMSQLQLANISYASDNNGKYVPLAMWDHKGVGSNPWFENPQFLGFLKGEAATYYSNGTVNKTIPLGMLDPIAVRAKKSGYNGIPGSFGYMESGMPPPGAVGRSQQRAIVPHQPGDRTRTLGGLHDRHRLDCQI